MTGNNSCLPYHRKNPYFSGFSKKHPVTLPALTLLSQFFNPYHRDDAGTEGSAVLASAPCQPITGTRLSVTRGAERAASPTIRFRMPDAGPGMFRADNLPGRGKDRCRRQPPHDPEHDKKECPGQETRTKEEHHRAEEEPRRHRHEDKGSPGADLSDTIPVTGAAQMIIETGRIASADAVNRLNPRTVVK